MNPFLLLAGPSLLVNVIVIALWKGYFFLLQYRFFNRFHRSVTIAVSLLIIFLMTWVVSFLAMIIFTSSLLDPNSSPQLILRAIREIYEYRLVVFAATGWNRSEASIFLIAILFAALATLLQKMWKYRVDTERKTSIPPFLPTAVHASRAS